MNLINIRHVCAMFPVPPDIPRNVSVINETMTTVTLSAVSPLKTGGLPVTSWVVQYETDAIERITKTFANGDYADLVLMSNNRKQIQSDFLGVSFCL